MNWISYIMRKPEAEPKRQIISFTRIGTYIVSWAGDENNSQNSTHWAEIEGPGEPSFVYVSEIPDNWEEVLASTAQGAVERMESRLPPPDPFERWWADNVVNGTKFEKNMSKAAWDAAIKHHDTFKPAPERER